MAEEKIQTIRDEAFSRFNLTCMHIYHSTGMVKAGEVCLFIFTSSAHREDCMKATDFLVEKIKKEVPIFGREIFEDDSHVWKVNR
jgi:molybdopterin synthase catalytic subunit